MICTRQYTESFLTRKFKKLYIRINVNYSDFEKCSYSYLSIVVFIVTRDADPQNASSTNNEWNRLCCILDPIMLITGIQSVFELRGELVAPKCEILKDFQRFSQFLRVFHGIYERLASCRAQTLCGKSDYTTRESSSKSLTQGYEFSSGRRFFCFAVTLNMTLTAPKSRFRTVSRRLCNVLRHDQIACSTPSDSRCMTNLISSGGRRH